MEAVDRSVLETKLLPELQEIGLALDIDGVKKLRKKDLINAILAEAGVLAEEKPMLQEVPLPPDEQPEEEQEEEGIGSGILDILSDGYGFLRTSGYLASEKDIYVSMSQIRRFRLKRGDEVRGQIRPPKDSEKYNALLRIEAVNGDDPEVAQRRRQFESLTPLYPSDRLRLETKGGSLTSRIIDLIAPVGKGQRGLIVSPPKAGKTTVLKQIANSITENNPEVYLMVLLVDERPEEVTDMERSVTGEVVSSTPGNSAVFCSSYEVMDGLIRGGLEKTVGKPLYIERQRAKSVEQDTLIKEFKSKGAQGGAVLLGVMGGRFSEGEDYPGDELNSAVIVGVPYPKPTSKVDAQIKYYESVFPGRGRDYGYVLPAMRKASQSAGRPFRNLDDVGAIVFLDYRYSTRFLAAYLPSWIRERVRTVDEGEPIAEAVAEFYKNACPSGSSGAPEPRG